MSRQPGIANPIIPPGSIILVTGANGLIGSHCVDQALAAGYKVRGTVRDVERCSWMNDLFARRYASGLLELIQVPDVYQDGHLDEAVRGVAAVIHTVPNSDSVHNTDPAPVLEKSKKTIIAALESAKKEPSIKRVVLTSSAWAAGPPRPNVDYYLDANCWNEEAIKAAWRKDPLPNGFDVLMATKTQAEQAAWRWVKENNPHFVLNAILPDTVMGHVLAPGKQTLATTGGLIKALYDGSPPEALKFMEFILPQWFISSVDAGRLHLIAAIDPEVTNERILGHAGTFSWDIILAMLREKFPEKSFVDDFNQGKDIGRVKNGRGNDLLVKHYNKGWASLREVVDASVQSWEKV